MKISKIELWPVDIALTDDFVISQGAIKQAENVFVRIVLDNGTEGFGELAPFEELTGESRDDGLGQLQKLAGVIEGRSVNDFRLISERMKELLPSQAAARCAIETALLDAYCRLEARPLWSLWCKAPRANLQTDITIPILGYEKSMKLAQHWQVNGFRVLQMKVGISSEAEIRLISDIQQLYPEFAFIVDANMGFQVEKAIHFINGLTDRGINMLLFEQPNYRGDLDGLRQIRLNTSVPVAADEAVFTLEDARRVIEKEAADVINLKIMKSGVLETVEIIKATMAAGLELMIGGMVETRIGMGCSFALAQSFPGIRYLDLDTPLLMCEDPLTGGYSYDGPDLIPSTKPGLGIRPKNIPES